VRRVVSTVDFSRAKAAQEATLAGCDVADSLTKKTTILIVGDQGMRLTRGQEKSSKHRKAETMIANGAFILSSARAISC
jgi:DNA polymerase-3 subunit epsilon